MNESQHKNRFSYKLKLKQFILFLLLQLTFLNVYGQQAAKLQKSLKFQHYSLNEGLSQSSVLSILHDNMGFLWFGTRDGLNKFDGHSFKTYRYDSKNKNSLSSSFIKTVFQDKQDNLWVGTSSGLNKYSPLEDNFERISLSENKNIAANIEIRSIVQADSSHLWLGTNQGLIKFDVKNKDFVYHNQDINQGNSLLSDDIRALLKSDDGNLWIYTTKSIDLFNPNTKIFKHYAYPENVILEANLSYVPTLYQDDDKTIWLGFKNGLAVFNKENDKFEFFKVASNGIDEIKDEVRSIHQDYLGNFWIGTYNGLYIIDKTKQSILQYLHDENDSNSLSQNSIFKITEDSRGDIWIGTYAGGVNYYDRSFDQFKYFTSGSNNTKLNYKVISSVIEDEDNNLWIGTEGGGINYFDKKTGLFNYCTHNPNDQKSISTNNVKAMIQSQKGDFWIGTHDGGLNFLNPKQKPFTFKKYANIPNDKNSLSNNRVISLLEDRNSDIWIGTSGGGLNKFDVKTGSFVRIENSIKTIGSIIFTISKTSNQDVLLVGGNNGLAKINVKTLEISPIEFYDTKSSARIGSVLSTQEDENKNLWIGTEGNGLYFYDTTTKKSVNYGLSEGLPNEVIYTILPDDNRNLWLSTNSGLSRFNIISKQFKNFDSSDGLLGNEFNYGASLKSKNGNLFFGSANGLIYFNPENINENAFVPPVSIISILVNNKPYSSESLMKKKLELKHDQSVFSFSFVALSYSQPNKNQYAYKLEGFDNDWNYIDNKKSATYTNLDAGSYTFKVKASNSDRLWNEKGESIMVKILPAPWKSWWAYLIYSFIILSLLYLIRKYSLLRIREKNELKQERIDKEKIEEINNLKLRLFTNISHDFRTPLTLIIGPLERMINKRMGNDFVKSQHETMHRNAKVLLQLINQLLDFRKSDSGKLKLKASEQNVVAFIEDIKLSFEDLAKVRDINFMFSTTEEQIDLWFDAIKLSKILYNLLSNAFKFTSDGGEIEIKLSIKKEQIKRNKTNEVFELIVKDNGKGIPKGMIGFVFDRFNQLSQKNQPAGSGTGIGLALTKNLVELHHGSIIVQSEENQGSEFIISLPLNNTHLSQEEIGYEATNTEEFTYLEGPNYIANAIAKSQTESTEQDEIIKLENSTILLVEDNDDVRAFVKNIFVKNYNIIEAENGKIALNIAKTNDIDLIISDVMMPVMDGVTLCENIKTDGSTSHIPVILLTARTSEDAQKEAYHTGADTYITKPFDAKLLEVRVMNLLNRRRELISKFKKELILRPKELVVTSADEVFLKRAFDIVEENISNSDFSIDILKSELAMSRSVLYRKIKMLTGQSISEFIRTIKLKRAAQLIAQTDMNISSIAYQFGFNDQKHFRKSFQKLFNELPSEYRKNHANSPEE